MSHSKRYERLNILDFGHQLLKSGDLDPIYIALHGMKLPRSQLHRWLLAYWCFYHAGAASYLSEHTGEGFWDRMAIAANNQTEQVPTCPYEELAVNRGWPRGAERRHFRGKQAEKAVAELRHHYPRPENAVVDLAPEAFIITNHGGGLPWAFNPEGKSVPFADINVRAQKWRGFGSWISFKIGDMLDRCAGVKVNFTEAEIFIFKDPWQAALMQWKAKHGAPELATIDDEPAAVKEIVHDLTLNFNSIPAPPDYTRPINIQEVETILCKWKSHVRGHYPVNNDIDEIREGVAPWAPLCTTAKLFLNAMPPGTHA